jgi:hypothetical protein
MSELLRALASHVRTLPPDDVHVVPGREWLEETHSLPAAEARMGRAKIVEPSGAIDPKPVGDAQNGRFAYFLDGIQCTRAPLYYAMIPVVYAYTAACVRKRATDGKMGGHTADSRESLYFPFSLIDPALLATSSIRVTDTTPLDTELEEHPQAILEAARSRISRSREEMEADLASNWLAEHDRASDWLLVDGSLSGDYDHYDQPNIVGIVKSHQTQYFEISDQRKILSLKPGERSGVFVPLGRKRREVYSWYVRMRPNAGQDVYFGLVRIEAAACERTLEIVDDISRWILAERAPLSLPDSRWDKMIYPIRDCEQYLRGIAPSPIMLEAVMSGHN